MAGVRYFLFYWLPVLAWMAVIFSASTDGMSYGHTSRLIGPILLWFNPDMAPETLDFLVALIRKTAHVVEYAILGLLVWRAFYRPQRHHDRPWNWRHAAAAWAVASAYAVTDEFHQSFVPSRGSSGKDVLLDIAGVVLGLAAAWVWVSWRRTRSHVAP